MVPHPVGLKQPFHIYIKLFEFNKVVLNVRRPDLRQIIKKENTLLFQGFALKLGNITN